MLDVRSADCGSQAALLLLHPAAEVVLPLTYSGESACVSTAVVPAEPAEVSTEAPAVVASSFVVLPAVSPAVNDAMRRDAASGDVAGEVASVREPALTLDVRYADSCPPAAFHLLNPAAEAAAAPSEGGDDLPLTCAGESSCVSTKIATAEPVAVSVTTVEATAVVASAVDAFVEATMLTHPHAVGPATSTGVKRVRDATSATRPTERRRRLQQSELPSTFPYAVGTATSPVLKRFHDAASAKRSVERRRRLQQSKLFFAAEDASDARAAELLPGGALVM